jgi:uncharacterized protein YjbJ (UPF0337 family)
MDENQIAGTARKVGGNAQQAFGDAIGDTKTEAEGVANQVKGAAQNMYGQARESASQVANAAATNVSWFENTLRNTIETQPYTAVFLAFGLGWLLGRTHRPM